MLRFRYFLAVSFSVFGLGAAQAACGPANAPAGSMGCMPDISPAQSSDELLIWRPSLFPNSNGVLSIQDLINSIAAVPFAGLTVNGTTNLNGPVNLTSVSTAPTAAPLTNNTQVGTTGYTDAAVGVETSRATAAESLKAPMANPTFTGTAISSGTLNISHNIGNVTTGFPVQGPSFGWNESGGGGEGDILLGPGAAGGALGLLVYQLTSGGALANSGSPILDLTGAGSLSVPGYLTSGTSTGGNSGVIINGPNADIRHIDFNTAGTLRWREQLVNANAGSNSGDDLEFVPYGDTGTVSVSALTINRATGNTTFSGQVGTPGLSAGYVNLIGSGTSTYDAQIKAIGGGSTAGQGQLQYIAALHQFLGFDGSEQVRILTAEAAADSVFLEGGQTGRGVTIGSYSSTDANVNAQFYAQGTGTLNFGNGSGMGLQIVDPGAASTSNLIVTGGSSTTINPVLSSSSGTIQLGSALLAQSLTATSATIGLNTGYGEFSINGQNTDSRSLNFSTGGVARWALTVSGTNTGSNAGDNLNIMPFSDAGTVISGESTVINRATGMFTFGGVTQLKLYTVATLPACTASNANGFLAVSDATVPTYNGALTGGGGVHIPVFCNGTSWTAH